MIKMPRCRRGKNVVGRREGGVHHKHDPRGARLQPSLPALLSGNPDSGHSGGFFFHDCIFIEVHRAEGLSQDLGCVDTAVAWVGSLQRTRLSVVQRSVARSSIGDDARNTPELASSFE